MVMIYTQRECKNDCFEDQIVTISNLKSFGHGRSLGQNNHYSRSYLTQKTLIIKRVKLVSINILNILHAKSVLYRYFCVNM